MNKIELLAPVGDMDSFYAAINNGANAIYLGGKQFSARAFATNFSNEEIKWMIQYAHQNGVQIYYISDRAANQVDATIKNLEKEGIPVPDLNRNQ